MRRAALAPVPGRRLALALALWFLLGAVVLGATVAVLRVGFRSGAAAHLAAVGAVLIAEAYAVLLAALALAFGGWSGIRDRLGFRFTSLRDLALAFGAWLASLFVGAVLSALAAPLLGTPRSNAVDLLGHSLDPLFVTLIVPTVCLLAPACEELLFRGAIFGWLRSHMPFLPAAVISAAIFAAAHRLPPLFPELFTYGLAAAWVVQRSGSTLNSFVMHACQNTLAVAVAYALLTGKA